MSSSRIHFRQRFIDASDAAMEVCLRLIVRAIDEIPNPPTWLAAAREDWNTAATMGAGFGVIPELNGFIVDEERRKIVLGFCEAAIQHLHELGDPITAATLNALGAGPSDSWFERDVPAAVFLGAATQFTELVRDTPLQ
jgi:hypothetical protein